MNVRRFLPIVSNRFPVKHAWDLMALAQVGLRGDHLTKQSIGLRGRLNCFSFFVLPGDIRRLHAAMPRSGSHWSGLGIALALELANGGRGDYTYENDAFWPEQGLIHARFDWRIPTGVAESSLNRTSGPTRNQLIYYQTRNPYYRLRSAQLKNMKIVLITRNILDSLASRFVKHASYEIHENVTLNDEDGFDWEKYLSESIDYFNSWGDVLTWHRSIRHYRYEDLVADPIAGHEELLDFWGLDVPRECIEEAFRLVSVEKMRTTMAGAAEDEPWRAAIDSRAIGFDLSDSRKRWIVDRLNADLVYPLGHRFSPDHKFSQLL